MIGILNILSFILIFSSVLILLYRFRKLLKTDSSIVLVIISFVILLLVTFTNLIEHIGITDYFDLFEDEIEIIFIPIFIFSIFSYCLKKELQINKEHEARQLDNHMLLVTSVEGAKEALWEWSSEYKQLKINRDYCYLDFLPDSFAIDHKNYEEIIHNDTKVEFQSFITSLLNNEENPKNAEIKILTITGEYRWFLLRGKKADQKLNTLETIYIGTLFDFTNYKTIQEELVLSKLKAEESEKLKTAFLNNISHEIRTPMNAIIGFTSILNTEDINIEKRKAFSQIIINSSNRLLRIIEDLIDISRISIGSIEVFSQKTDTNTILFKLFKKFENQTIEKGLEFKINNKNSYQIFSDELKIIKIMSQLIDNSIKYTEKGIIEIGCEINSKEIMFYVKDTGIGIDKKYHEIIFQNFRQVEFGDSRFYDGAGIGLSICKGLVNVLGGKIYIESEYGEGTLIHFTIPFEKILYHFENESTNALNQKWEGKILIAEDEEMNYRYLFELLENKFDTVLWAENGQQAIDIFDQNPDIRIILMDIKMPILNGIDATKIIKEKNKNIPIMAQTAFITLPEQENIQSVFDAYLVKPFSEEKLFNLINELLKKENNLQN